MTPADYAKLAARVYSDPPDFGVATGSARAKVYDGVVVFRGTDDPASILTDVEAVTTPVMQLGYVHKGFWEAYSTVAKEMMKLSPDVIVGHSLGGALALLYAADLCRFGKAPKVVYAFEPPRLCIGTAMEDLFQENKVEVFATRNGLDIVTEVPTWMSLPADLRRIGRAADLLDNLEDHAIDRVITALGG